MTNRKSQYAVSDDEMKIIDLGLWMTLKVTNN